MFSGFLGLTPPRFLGVPSEDVFEFLTAYEDWLCNFFKVKAHTINYTTSVGLGN